MSELSQLLAKYEEQSLSETEAERLLVIVRDPATLVEAKEALAVHGLLQTAADGDESGELLLARVEGVVELERQPGQFEDAVVLAIRGKRKQRRILLFLAAAAAAVLVAWPLLRNPQVEATDEQALAGLRELPIDAGPVAALLAQETAVWTGRENLAIGTPFGAGAYQLSSGAAALQTKDGNLIVIRAPAEFELAGESLQLLRGEAGVRLRTGSSFEMRTPGLRIVDLGTEFAVRVDEFENTRLYVYDGAVAVFRGADNAKPDMRVVAGTGLQYSASAGFSLISEAEGLLMPSRERQRMGIQDYERLVRSQKPLRYWRFDPSDADGQLLQSAGVARERFGANNVLRFDRLPLETIAEGLRSNGGLVPGGVIESPLTFSLWFSSEELIWKGDFQSEDRRILLGLVVPNADEEGLQPVNFSVELMNERTAKDHFRLRALYRNPPSVVHGLQLISVQQLPVRAWHHLAVRITPKQINLWLNGEPAVVGHMQTSEQPLPEQMRVVFGQRSERGKDQRYFAGGLDEVAIFDRLLTDDQIRDQYRLGRELFYNNNASLGE